ncbi:MAG: site-specific integrase [Rhodobacteraceae bacterium]|nr:site-specific integrase [Paracoccaceae bacterium]
MTLLSNKTTRSEWIHTSDAIKTQKHYRCILVAFDDWLKSMDSTEEGFFDAMRGTDMSTRARTLKSIQEYWMTVPKKGYPVKSPRTTAQYRAALLQWFEENDIMVSPTKIKRLARLPKISTEMRYTPDSSHILRIVSMQNTIEKKAFFILLSCTAMRYGELMQTRLGDIDMSNRMIRIPAARTKTRTERLTFFTPEARHYLKKHIKENNIQHDDLIFQLSEGSYRFAQNRSNRILGANERFTNGRYKMSIHRLRAYANQCISSAVSERFADVIKGHIGGLRTYDVGNIRKMKKDYDKAIPELTLDKSRQYEDLKDQVDAGTKTDAVIMREIDHLKQEIERLTSSIEE